MPLFVNFDVNYRSNIEVVSNRVFKMEIRFVWEKDSEYLGFEFGRSLKKKGS